MTSFLGRLRRWPRYSRTAVVGLVSIAVLESGVLSAQDVSEPSLKAAFVFNFVRFTEWPQDALPAGAPLVTCVLGETSVGSALERTVRGRVFGGHSLTVTPVNANGPLKSCHVLYVSAVSPAQATEVLATVRGAPVLSVIDVDGFTRGGVARMFVEGGKMRFDLDNGLAKRSRLSLRSQMLTLASRVHDDPGAP